MTTLLFVEHGNGQIKDSTLKALAGKKVITVDRQSVV